MGKRALITGVTGQDGAYLAEFLLEKDYQVYGLVRRSRTTSYERLQHIQDRILTIPGDLQGPPIRPPGAVRAGRRPRKQPRANGLPAAGRSMA